MIDLNMVSTLKELDTKLEVVKGTSFRLFKGVLKNLTEGEDYYYLDANDKVDAATIFLLKEAGRIYDSTNSAVLITTELSTKLMGLHSIVKDKL